MGLELEVSLEAASLSPGIEVRLAYILPSPGPIHSFAIGGLYWLCDGMIFNHDPPRCFDCWECGGSSRCGMDCSALMSNNTLGDYPVCTTIGSTQSITTNLLDKENPGKGVAVEMWHQGPEMNCSLSVSVICDSKQVQATQIKHPAGCANVLATKGNGLGWFVYLITGSVYRFFYLGIRGIDIIPNLEFWASLPHRVQSSFMSLVRKFGGPS